ncbi:MAG: hypothetical protein BECKG1743D_GA0114223_101975 [Candidatus Kentron sp. G]|nr:MAG: hypothetical protein BECKG1743F_GA0114225_101682 [Candidatus Kentron sp. G]VFM97849.1 MAG: hypothetical protein BECKG1743E_GA0114224_101526 [Candidatus Kentron sp. G]VFN00461.1 MAG: hypothetical protein BECKG1743D_GA0114223_101975 [Candidatus Kentron sp. G]
MRNVGQKLFGNSHRSEVALRLWSLQGAMGAKIRTVVNYTTQFLPPSQRSRTQFGRHRSRLRVSKQLLRLVQAWITIHEDELMADWTLAVKGEPVFPIEPLR